MKSYYNFNYDYILMRGTDGYQLLHKHGGVLHRQGKFDCHKQPCHHPVSAGGLRFIGVCLKILTTNSPVISLVTGGKGDQANPCNDVVCEGVSVGLHSSLILS